jgi:hypothetical protein
MRKHFISYGLYTAVMSFAVGTVIVGLYYFTMSFIFAFIGMFYAEGVVAVNIIVLIIMIIQSCQKKVNCKKVWKTLVLMLVNIPVAILYFWLAIFLTDTVRLTLSNVTKDRLTDVNIAGCESRHLNSLESGESKTIWIPINGDCSVSVSYVRNGVRDTVNATGYVSTFMGGFYKYNIGGKNLPIERQ